MLWEVGKGLPEWGFVLRQGFIVDGLAGSQTDGANNGGTEAINGRELHHWIVRGFRNRDNCELRMLLIEAV